VHFLLPKKKARLRGGNAGRDSTMVIVGDYGERAMRWSKDGLIKKLRCVGLGTLASALCDPGRCPSCNGPLMELSSRYLKKCYDCGRDLPWPEASRRHY